jgi:hypothetical protein
LTEVVSIVHNHFVNNLSASEPLSLIGIHEIAVLGDVGSSAVANWRKRFDDFPAPVADLKSGPVFREDQIKVWLAKRLGKELTDANSFYDQLAAKRGDSAELIAKVEETVAKLEAESTSTKRPGMLLGKIQSGKTRAFLGIIARSFDRGYDVAVILTKGTKSLAKQTVMRVRDDFSEFLQRDQVQVYDIMSVPSLTPYELNQKLIFIVKKEDDNLDRLLKAFERDFPVLQQKKVLIVDDEADLASVSFRKGKDGTAMPGVISQQIDRLRELSKDSDFLQVTATPYSLYLQPEEDVIEAGQLLFKPRRPAFIVVLPTHGRYVGGDYYFEKNTDAESPAYYFYREVPLEEREALKVEDRRRIKIEHILSEKRAAVLCDAIFTFLVGGAILRLQARARKDTPDKYAFLFHTEQARKSHDWQERIAVAIRDSLIAEAHEDTPRFNELLHRSYSDLKRSVNLEGSPLPSLAEVKTELAAALTGGQLMITKVNSEGDIEQLLDQDGQLKLRTPYNLFIGGQILDRGITINNLIGFYYGRNPKKFQQDTVLQHSRMYGARSMNQLAVTRFYAPQNVYQIMRNIHGFDAALRDAFESGAHERGVYFIQKDPANRVVSCSPNKLMFSQIVSIRPGRRLLPVGFQTISKTNGAKTLQSLDSLIEQLGDSATAPLYIPVESALELLTSAYSLLEFEIDGEDERRAHIAALEHLSRTSIDVEHQGKVLLLTAKDRNVRRYREEGRFSNAPDTKQQTDMARLHATQIPVLMLLRQNGKETDGWRDLPFWWPVIVTPDQAITSVFASATPGTP